MAQTDSDYHLNVPMGPKSAKRVLREERTWSGAKLVIFGALFLGLCLFTLYMMSSTTSETTWSDWLFPWPT